MHFYLLTKQLLLDLLSKSFEKVLKFGKSSAFVTILAKKEEENVADKEEESWGSEYQTDIGKLDEILCTSVSIRKRGTWDSFRAVNNNREH